MHLVPGAGSLCCRIAGSRRLPAALEGVPADADVSLTIRSLKITAPKSSAKAEPKAAPKPVVVKKLAGKATKPAVKPAAKPAAKPVAKKAAPAIAKAVVARKDAAKKKPSGKK